MCLYRELFELRHKMIMYKRGTYQGQTQKNGPHLKNKVRKAEVQQDLVRNANNYRSPERDVWNKLEKKEREREIDSNSGKIISY